MPANLKKYLINAVMLTGSIYIIGFLLSLTSLKTFYLPVFPYLPVFFLVINLLIYLIVLKAAEKNPYKFNSYFLLTTTLKLFIYFAVVIIYFLVVKVKILEFAVTFFTLYIIFTFFEARAIIKTLKKGKNNT